MKYHLARGEEQLGTFSDLEVSSGLRNGQFLRSDLCWTDGMQEWMTLGDHLKELGVDVEVVEASAPPAAPPLPREDARQDNSVEQETATRGQRLAAWFIDVMMVMIPSLIMLATLMDEAFTNELRSLQQDPQAAMQALQRQIDKVIASGNPTLLALNWFMNILMIANVVMLTVRGQTVGKLLIGIHIVRFSDGARAGFLKAVLLRGMLFGILAFLPVVGPFLLISDSLMIFRKDRRCLHDLVADTKVVRRQQRS